MKKSLIAAASCFVVGVVGLTCTLPMAAQEGVSLYNDVVSNLEENLQKQDLPQEIISLRVIHLTDYGYGQRFIEVRQSPDAQIHLYTADGDTAQVTTEGQSAVIRLQEQETLEGQQLHFSREGLLNLLREEMRSHHTIIIEVPKTVSITSGSQDGVYFGVGGGVEFVNFAQIREYGYLPTEEETLKNQYEEQQVQLEMLQQELQQSQMENEVLKEQLMQQQEYAADDEQQTTAEETIATEGISVAPSDILQLERQMEKDREIFQKYAMSKESYLTALWDNSQKITAYREKQLLDAGRDDLLPLMEELEANIYQYNEVDAELLSSQHDFQDGTITQQQYNSVVQAYEQLLKELDEEIDQQKAKLAEEGYYWEGVVLLNN